MRGGGGGSCVRKLDKSRLKWSDGRFISTHRAKLESFPVEGGLTCAIQSPPTPLHLFPERPSATLGAAENHICLDKNRSIPRNQIQRRREIPDKVVRYADHTATEAAEAAAAQAAAGASLLAPQSLCFPTASWMWRDNRSHGFKELFAQKSLYLYYHSLKQSNASFIIFE